MAEVRLSDQLYDRCNHVANSSDEGFKKQFTQAEMLNVCNSAPLDHVKGGSTLLPLLNQLTAEALIITLKKSTGNCWSFRPRAAAKGVRGLSKDERMVYEVIESSYEKGEWIRGIKNKTGIKDSPSMEKLLKALQRAGLIKNVKNVKAQNQKTYMLSYLAPSDEITGGSFYDAGELDESLVEELSNLIVFHVRQMSWVEEKRKRIKKEQSPILVRDDEDQTTAGASDTAGGKKRKRGTTANDDTHDIEDSAPPPKQRSHKHGPDPETDTGPNQLAYQAGHAYPTAASIHSYITSNNIIRTVKANSLTVDEVQNVVNVLVWDEKLEEVNGGYRTVRGVTFKQPGEEDDEPEEEEKKRGNGLTEAPCGRCPVIDLCGNGGLINAATCVYFDRWLSHGEGA